MIPRALGAEAIAATLVLNGLLYAAFAVSIIRLDAILSGRRAALPIAALLVATTSFRNSIRSMSS